MFQSKYICDKCSYGCLFLIIMCINERMLLWAITEWDCNSKMLFSFNLFIFLYTLFNSLSDILYSFFYANRSLTLNYSNLSY